MLGLRRWQGVQVDLFQGDITRFVCDALVNAANEQLVGGGGVDGAVHRVGGPSILAECRRIGSCPTGQAVVTGAGALPARWVVHTVGPIWRGGGEGEAELLASAHRESLAAAARRGARHVAIPAISTGVYGYPAAQAAAVAMATVKAHIESGAPAERVVRRITFVLYSAEHYTLFQEALFRTFPEEDV